MTVERVGAERMRRVTNGYLRSSGPNGVIPAGLGRLWALRARELRFNRLTRAIPPDLGEIGPGLQNLQPGPWIRTGNSGVRNFGRSAGEYTLPAGEDEL